LNENGVRHEVVDGMEDEQMRIQLFAIAGMSASYPQFFVKDGSDQIAYLGNFDAIRRSMEQQPPLKSKTHLSPKSVPKLASWRLEALSTPPEARSNIHTGRSPLMGRLSLRGLSAPVLVATKSSQDGNTTKDVQRAKAPKVVLPPETENGNERERMEAVLPFDSMPQAQQSLRPSTIRGFSFNDNSSDTASSDGEALFDLLSLRPSMLRGHSFDDDKRDHVLGVEKESRSSLPVAESIPQYTAAHKTAYRPSFGREGSFNRSPWENDAVRSKWESETGGIRVIVSPTTKRIERNSDPTFSRVVDIWEHSCRKNDQRTPSPKAPKIVSEARRSARRQFKAFESP
jgi:hypothetical protein